MFIKKKNRKDVDFEFLFFPSLLITYDGEHLPQHWHGERAYDDDDLPWH